MKPTKKIRDNSKEDKSNFNDISRLTSKIADKTLQQLEHEGIFVFPEIVKEADDLTRDQKILRSNGSDYCSGNVMGFLGCGDERLVIESRFAGQCGDFFSLYLLEKVQVINPNIVDLHTDADQDNRLFNFLLFLFPYYLESAMRKGLFKKYILKRYNDSNVTGIIDLDEHIRKNIPFIGDVSYIQREFSYDNPLTELIRHTIEFIKHKQYGNQLLRRVKDEVKVVIDATRNYALCDRQKIIQLNTKNKVRHAYFREYQSLQRLCLMILKNCKHQIGSGKKQVYGILFDGAWLWEEYVYSLIEKHFHHPRNKGGGGGQRLFDHENKKIGLIYPDFISKNNQTRVIADAKYKPLENIGRLDYFQILAYMFRFDAKGGFFLYPEDGQSIGMHLRLNRGSTFEKDVLPRDDIFVRKHGLKIPGDAPDYQSFVREMEVNEKQFVADLLNG